jgi:2-polyprenyl-3-methyl-5-hydroxy-6-metoxy-1,4-benzoquinol methylase
MFKNLKKLNFEEIHCPTCESKEYKILSNKGGFHIIHINLSICKNCGFVYLNPRWDKKGYNYFYERLYDKFVGRTINQKGQELKYDLILERINNTKRFKKKGLNILDIGAGMGNGLLKFISHFESPNAFAIEPSQNGQKNLQNNNIKILSNDIDSDWDQSKNKFDIIVLRHVLEHFLSPNQALQKINNSLSKNGIFYVEVPNLDEANFPLTKDFFRVAHTLYFSQNSLRFILEKNGFEIIEIVNKRESSCKENFGDVYAVCKKGEVKNIIPLNEFESSYRKIRSLLKKEKTLSFQLFWGTKIFLSQHVLNSSFSRRLGLKKVAIKTYQRLKLQKVMKKIQKPFS